LLLFLCATRSIEEIVIMTGLYSIVDFIGHNECEAVPSAWVFDDEDGNNMTWWPPFAGASKQLEAIKKRAAACSTWAQYHVRILGHAG